MNTTSNDLPALPANLRQVNIVSVPVGLPANLRVETIVHLPRTPRIRRTLNTFGPAEKSGSPGTTGPAN